MAARKTLQVLLSLSFAACAASPVRTAKPLQGWRIDPELLTLYRQVSVEEEDVMRIIQNPEMEQFTCFDKDATKELILRSKEAASKK
jgi:hypothetical protein